MDSPHWNAAIQKTVARLRNERFFEHLLKGSPVNSNSSSSPLNMYATSLKRSADSSWRVHVEDSTGQWEEQERRRRLRKRIKETEGERTEIVYEGDAPVHSDSEE